MVRKFSKSLKVSSNVYERAKKVVVGLQFIITKYTKIITPGEKKLNKIIISSLVSIPVIYYQNCYFSDFVQWIICQVVRRLLLRLLFSSVFTGISLLLRFMFFPLNR